MHEFSVNCQSIQMRTCGYESISTICPRQAEIEKVEINVGTFVIAEFDFAVKNVSSENDKSITRRLLAVIKDADHNQFAVIYSKTINKQRFKTVENDISVITRDKIISTLPFPNLRRDIYEFDQNIDVDV